MPIRELSLFKRIITWLNRKIAQLNIFIRDISNTLKNKFSSNPKTDPTSSQRQTEPIKPEQTVPVPEPEPGPEPEPTQIIQTPKSTNRLEELLQKQQETYQEVFLLHPTDFHHNSYHYDWWMFPLEAPDYLSETSKHYSVNNEEVKNLLADKQFISYYTTFMDAYLANLKSQGWNHYEVRFAKMLCSLNKFIAVSNELSQDNNIKEINDNLFKLANEAIDFAQAKIPLDPKNPSRDSVFLQKELEILKNSAIIKVTKPKI